MKLQNLRDLLVEELKDLYNAEHQLVKALPRLATAAHASELKLALEHHLQQTRGHVERIEQVFEGLGLPARGKRCRGMEGIIEEAQEILEQDGDLSVIDAGLIAAAQKAEHYEIATYGCVCAHARMLGDGDVVELLTQTLEEEKATDHKLTLLAERLVNLEAVEAPHDPRRM
jgi:ferritin-like metal-binding protein YciE